MSRDGSGVYSLPEAAFVYDTVISETAVNNNFSDIASALTASIAKDGQTTPTANLPMGTYRHTGVGNATARTDYAAAGQVQDSAFVWCGTAGGTKNAITLTPSPAITAYAAGQKFRFISGATQSDDAVTVAVSGLSAKAVQNNGSALSASSYIEASKMYEITYDGTQFQIASVRLAGPGTVTSVVAGTGLSGGTITGSGTIAIDITGLTAETSVASGDLVSIYDVSASSHRKMTVANLTALVSGADDDGRYQELYNALTWRRATGTQGGTGLVKGHVDAYLSDTIGSASSNETYDSSGDYYHNAASTSYSNAGGTGNRTASITATVSPSPSSGSASALVDGTTDGSNGVLFAGGETNVVFKFDFGNGNAKVIQETKIYLNSDGFNHGTYQWAGSDDDVSYTNIGATFSLVNTVTGANGYCLNTTMSANTTSYRHYRLTQTAGTAQNDWINEFEFKLSASLTPQNMTLTRGGAVTSTTTPTTAWVLSLVDPVSSVTYNTDYTVEVTSNNGTNWDAVTLTNVGSYDGTYDILVGKVTLTGGSTSINYRKKSLNNKELRDAGISMMWN